MFDPADFETLHGEVSLHTFTCSTTATAIVPDPGMKLIIFGVHVDGPTVPPRYFFTDG